MQDHLLGAVIWLTKGKALIFDCLSAYDSCFMFLWVHEGHTKGLLTEIPICLQTFTRLLGPINIFSIPLSEAIKNKTEVSCGPLDIILASCSA